MLGEACLDRNSWRPGEEIQCVYGCGWSQESCKERPCSSLLPTLAQMGQWMVIFELSLSPLRRNCCFYLFLLGRSTVDFLWWSWRLYFQAACLSSWPCWMPKQFWANIIWQHCALQLPPHRLWMEKALRVLLSHLPCTIPCWAGPGFWNLGCLNEFAPPGVAPLGAVNLFYSTPWQKDYMFCRASH